MMKDFEDARMATEEMFENEEQLSLDDATQAQEAEEQPTETVETPAEEVVQAEQVQEEATPENVALENAVNTAPMVDNGLIFLILENLPNIFPLVLSFKYWPCCFIIS
jgi:hypothetical protein